MPLYLNDDNLKQIDAFLGEIPAKYSLNVILYFNQISQAQQKAAADQANAKANADLAPKAAVELKAVPADAEAAN